MCEGFNFSMFLLMPIIIWASQVVLVVKNSPVNAEDVGDMGLTSGQENPLEEGMAAHSSIFAGGSHGQRSQAGCSS